MNYLKMNIRKEVLIVWSIYSTAILVFLVLLFSLEKDILQSLSPVCYKVKLYSEPCIMCGMTRAFLEIKSFHWANSLSYNKMSIFCFILMISNTLIYLNYLTKKYANS